MMRIRPAAYGLALCLMVPWLSALAEEGPVPAEAHVAERAKSEWESGFVSGALEVLDQWLQAHPKAFALHKLRGDMFATSRRPAEALRAYDTALVENPDALDVRWARWSVLVRSGHPDEAIEELRRIAQADAANPLVRLKLAQELRKLDRLEESLEPYRKSVELAPEIGRAHV